MSSTREQMAALKRRAEALGPAAFFISGWLVYLVFLYPGFMSTDSVHQLLEARRGEIADWHSPAMTWLWGAVDRIAPGPSGMLFLQSTALWAALWVIYRRTVAGRAPLAGAALFSGLMFFPPVFGVAGVVWKDILMWAALTGAVAALASFAARRAAPGSWRAPLAVYAACCLAAALMRPNAIFFIAALSILPASSLFERRRGAMYALLSVGAASLALLAVASAVNRSIAVRATHPELSIALFDISGVVANAGNAEKRAALFDEIPEALRAGSSPERLAETYSPRYWQDVFAAEPPGLDAPETFETDRVAGFAAWSDRERAALIRAWKRMIADAPGAYLAHRARAFGEAIGAPTLQWQPVLMQPAHYPDELKAIYAPPREQTGAQKLVEAVFYRLSIFWPYKPWFYLLAALALLAFNASTAKLASLESALCLAALAHEAGLFFLAPSADYRYSHIAVFSVSLALLLTGLRARYGGGPVIFSRNSRPSSRSIRG